MLSARTRQSNRIERAQSSQFSGVFAQRSKSQHVASFFGLPSRIQVLFLILALVSFPGAQSETSSQAQFEHSTSSISSINERMMAMTLKELLEKLKETTEGANQKVNEAANPEEYSLKRVIPGLSRDLNAIEFQINTLLDPSKSPSLTPFDAGVQEPVDEQNSLEDYSEATLDLAIDALAAYNSLSQPLRDQVIGSKVKTILLLLPGYREEAGL
jgi:hypothetical protein